MKSACLNYWGTALFCGMGMIINCRTAAIDALPTEGEALGLKERRSR